MDAPAYFQLFFSARRIELQMAPNRPMGFKFTRLDTIGTPDAEMDKEFLQSCFIDTGDLAVLSAVNDPRVILLGRTGTGKSALLERMTNRFGDQVISVLPESLALSHIANSQILNFVQGLGINMDPLFKLLWRHVFVVELLRRYFNHHATTNREHGFIAWLQCHFKGESRETKLNQQAIDYLREWGESFWEETEYRVKEITRKIEGELESAVGASLGTDFASISGQQSIRDAVTEEEKAEILARAQEIVSRAQVQDLNQVTRVLSEVLSNRQHPYYVVLDRLDENWIEEKLRYQLIKALVLTAREFVGTTNAKIIVAIRRDLIDRVFRLTRDSGFQEEKFAGSFLRLTWTKDQILELLDRRVEHLVSSRYTKGKVGYRDVLPEEFDSKEIGTAVFSIAHRPRDVIALFNCCILAGQDKSYIGAREFSIALGEYSRGRLRALADEWHGEFPQLMNYASVLRGRAPIFKLGSLEPQLIEDLCLQVAAELPAKEGAVHVMAHAVVDGDTQPEVFRETLLHGFYKCGLVGLKIAADSKASWADDAGQAVTRNQLTEHTSVSVHPAYTRALGMAVDC
jgi:hypothetical protein